MRHPNAGPVTRAARTEAACAATVVTIASCTADMIRTVAAPTSLTGAARTMELTAATGVARAMAAHTAAHAAVRGGEEEAMTAAAAVEETDRAGSAVAGAGTASTLWESTIGDAITTSTVGQTRRRKRIAAREKATSATACCQLNKTTFGSK